MRRRLRIKVWRGLSGRWWRECPLCPYSNLHPTHAEALAAAWAHIKEHS